jgi:hypothetical protein
MLKWRVSLNSTRNIVRECGSGSSSRNGRSSFLLGEILSLQRRDIRSQVRNVLNTEFHILK